MKLRVENVVESVAVIGFYGKADTQMVAVSFPAKEFDGLRKGDEFRLVKIPNRRANARRRKARERTRQRLSAPESGGGRRR